MDNMDWEGQGATGGGVTRQSAFNLGALSTDNWIRVQEQNKKRISVIIGNPPYNANQQNENDNNPNRPYREVDWRISQTYVNESTAQKTKQYDMYKRFIRWASDRLSDDGIIAFVSNSAFLDARQDDGFRKVVAKEFNELWVLDLKGNARTSGERRRREGGNVFDDKIRVGIAIYFLVRSKDANGFRLFYNAVDDYAKSPAKVEYIRGQHLTAFDFSGVTPDAKNIWLDQTDTHFDSLVPVANKQTKLARLAEEECAVFSLFSLGIASNRDEWVWDFNRGAVSRKTRMFVKSYKKQKELFEKTNPRPNPVRDWVDRSIKWTSELEAHLVKGHALDFESRHIGPALFRPYVPKYLYCAPMIVHRRYQMPRIFPYDRFGKNKAICFSGTGSSKPFQVLATDRVYSLDLLEKSQCLPLYRYTADGERVTNITQWGLRRFREHYGDDDITPEDIFAYTYAALHDPVYRETYAVDLRREFPGLPFHDEFREFVRMGQELLDLHIGFESVEPWPLLRENVARKSKRKPKARLRANKVSGAIVLDDATRLTGVPEIAWSYRLGNRSAIEWVLEQHKELKPKDPTIAKRFNTYRFADHKPRVIDLLSRVCTVSVRTMDVVEEIAARSSVR